MRADALEARELAVRYRDKAVLDKVSFKVNQGESWAVIGRNGAGKSTLLKCLCGLIRPERGSVKINDKMLAQLSYAEIARKVAFVPQGNDRTVPPFTVEKFVRMSRFAYNTWFQSFSEDETRLTRDALELTDTAHLSKRMMNTLSGGELQSVLLAGAVAQDTPFLLLDEPTTFLDPCHQEQVANILERVKSERNSAVITVTHDINFALSTHSHLMGLSGGKTVFSGTKESFAMKDTDLLTKLFSVDFSKVALADGACVYASRRITF